MKQCKTPCKWQGNKKICEACQTQGVPVKLKPLPLAPFEPDAPVLRGHAVKAKGRQRVPGEMNKLEQAYAAYLSLLVISGEIWWWKFEGMTFKLADDTRYTPDFAIMYPDGRFELHDTKAAWKDKKKGGVKPHFEDDAKVKIKVAASLYPFTFKAVWKNEQGGWEWREF